MSDITEAEAKKVRVSEELSALEQDVMRIVREFDESVEGRDELREEVEQTKSELTELTNSLNRHKSELQDLMYEKEKLVFDNIILLDRYSY